MAGIEERFGFFDGELQSDGSYAPSYKEEDFSSMFGSLISTGVLAKPPRQLKVEENTGLTVRVNKGRAWIEGHWYILNKDAIISFSPRTQTSHNVVLLRLDKSNKTITLTKKENTKEMKPVNNGVIHEIYLCEFDLPGNQENISDSIIKDLRPRSEYCGFVVNLVQTIDVSDFYNNMYSRADDLLNDLKGKLGSDPAIRLQQQLNETNSMVTENRNKLVRGVPEVLKFGNAYAFKFASGLLIQAQILFGEVNFKDKWGDNQYYGYLPSEPWEVPFLNKPMVLSVCNVTDTGIGAVYNSVKGTTNRETGNLFFGRPFVEKLNIEAVIVAIGTSGDA